MRTAYFTIVSKNYLHFARCLMGSLGRFDAEASRFVVLADRDGGEIGDLPDSFSSVPFAELGLPDERRFLFRYNLLEFSTAIKPWAFEWVLSRGPFECVVYLDPDIFVYQPLDEALQLLKEGSLVLTPHLTGALDDGKAPREEDILRAGTYNLGFLALRRHPEALRFLDWWKTRLETKCVIEPDHGLFVDQRWIDLVPGVFGGVKILRAPGYNVAYWNLAHRSVESSGGEWMVDGSPLTFFHFSGLDPFKPKHFSRHQDRYRLKDLGPIRELVDNYCRAVLSEEAARYSKMNYAFATFEDGLLICDPMRRYYRQHPEVVARLGPNPFDTGSSYFRTPEGSTVSPDLTPFARAVWESAPAIQSAYPDLDGSQRYEYAVWFSRSAGKRLVPPGFAEPVLAAVKQFEVSTGSRGRHSSVIGRLYARLKGVAKPLTDRIPERLRKLFLDRVEPVVAPRSSGDDGPKKL